MINRLGGFFLLLSLKYRLRLIVHLFAEGYKLMLINQALDFAQQMFYQGAFLTQLTLFIASIEIKCQRSVCLLTKTNKMPCVSNIIDVDRETRHRLGFLVESHTSFVRVKVKYCRKPLGNWAKDQSLPKSSCSVTEGPEHQTPLTENSSMFRKELTNTARWFRS